MGPAYQMYDYHTGNIYRIQNCYPDRDNSILKFYKIFYKFRKPALTSKSITAHIFIYTCTSIEYGLCMGALTLLLPSPVLCPCPVLGC